MAAYVIVDIQITDPVRYEEYKKMAAPTVAAYDGRYIVRGGTAETVEGRWVPGRVVVLEFPSLERAKEWWASEMYEPAKALRHASANTEMILVQGM
ncbi:MAG: D-fructose-6-phosphate amidotransferase [Gemmatimonas sp. SG8_38_2]|nr:MAG: D-fructose-6-phosphate amidotransferase [Gemmatimonas sp. SG8_38_2]